MTQTDPLLSLLQQFKDFKVCLVTDWLTNLGGGERVLEAVSDLFPECPIYTTVCDRDNIGDTLKKRDIRTSFLQKIPYFYKRHQWLLPLLPRAIESLDVSEFDIVLSFSSFGAKSIKTSPHQVHICYLHTPVRYAWEPDFDPRVQALPFWLKPLVKWILKGIKKWDYQTRNRPDLYIANSTTTQNRVRDYYALPSQVLYPPVEVGDFEIGEKQDYYLSAGRMVPYKKSILIAQAFEKMPDKKLIMLGDGTEFEAVKNIADNTSNITVLGRVDRRQLVQIFSHAKAFILPQKEDAGIVQLEAFASGTPVIAYQAGGVLDVLKEGVNGVFFDSQSMEGIMKGVQDFECQIFDPEIIRKTAQAYDTSVFQQRYLTIVLQKVLSGKVDHDV